MKKSSYPENLVVDIGTDLICGTEQYIPLSPAQLSVLEEAIDSLPCEEKNLLIMRYKKEMKYQSIIDMLGDGTTRWAAQTAIRIALRKLRVFCRKQFENKSMLEA